MDKEKARALLTKYLEGNCNDQESLLVESWYNKLNKETENIDTEPDWELTRERILNNLPPFKSRRIGKLQRYAAAAAVILFITTAGSYLYIKNEKSTPYANDVKPGGNKAFLTLANGKKINLDDVNTGEIARETNLKITKAASGKIVYTILDNVAANGKGSEYNTFETPKGGKYQVVLPDGTAVLLNAGSSLRYPSMFSSKERKVELNGEAYFEVAHNKEKPFIVTTGRQSVQVLGTHFNINAYQDETTVNTTLLEGKVKVTGDGVAAILKPGQQSILTRQTKQLKVQDADIETTMAWKNGNFIFKEEDLESIMRKVSKWYDVDIVYNDNAPRALTLGGWVSRSKNISAVLKIMEMTGKVHFKVEGRRVTVMQ